MNLKFIFILSLLVFILPINLFAQWVWKNPNPQANTILDSYFIDDMNGWAVGYCGACIKTADGGETWVNIRTPINTNFKSVHFVDLNKGFIGDWGGNLLTTTDGGYNWSVQHFDNYSRIHVFFVNQNYGWLLSSNGTEKIYRTTNGGETWESHLLNTTRYMLDLFFIDSSKGFVAGGFGDILMTTNGGINWNYVNSPVTEFLYKIVFKNPLEGFIVGSAGTILQTSDGGINWDYRAVGQYTHFDISFFGQDKGIIVGAKTYITNNGGNTWVPNYFIGENSFNTCNYLDENNCIVLGYSGNIYKSTGNLYSWELKVYGDRNTISDMIFLNSMTGFTVGSEGTILQTFDGGSHWPKQAPLTNEKLTSISFSDNQHGWVVGTNSVFLKSTTSGTSWIANSIPDCYDLFSVDFINNNIGWVAGNYNKILKTTDGGNTWIQQPINFAYTIDFSSISMIDENIGYAVGNYRSFFPPKGIIFKTTNGGIEWDSLKCFNSYFNSMFFQNLLDGWVVGETQDITIHTTDGGISWTNVTIGGGNDILFSDSHDGIIVDRSDIKITTDGGETWAQQPIVTDQSLNAAYIIENNYWTAGTKGAILFSDNPVVTNVEFETNADEYPNEYRLFQNFPNPFNPRTNIKYAIDSKQFVTLKVYDILGREVAMLVNEEKPHGEYEVEFDGSGLSSGIYLYSLVVGDFAITKKLVFIK